MTDEGRTALLRGDLNAVLLEAAKVIRENNDPKHGRRIAVSNTEVQTLQFLPR